MRERGRLQNRTIIRPSLQPMDPKSVAIDCGTKTIPCSQGFFWHSHLQQDHNVAWPVGSEFFFGFLDGSLCGFPKVLGLVGFLLLESGEGGNQSGTCGHNSHVPVVGGSLCGGGGEANSRSSARSSPAGCHSEGGRRDHLGAKIVGLVVVSTRSYQCVLADVQ